MPDDPNAEIRLELKNATLQMTKATTEVKTFAEKAVEEIKNLGTLTKETKENADKALLEMGQFTTRIADIEQKIARHGGGGVDQAVLKSLGEHIINNEEVKTRLLGGQQKGIVSFAIETKAILSATASWGPTTSVGTSLVAPDRQIATLALPMRQMTIRDLVAPGSTTSNAIEYAIQTTRTNAAAPVAEGALKPSSNYAWDLRSFPVRTIAHLVKASRQILDDAPGLQSIIDAEMRYGLAFAEEALLLYGDGTGQNVLGIVPQASAYSAAFVVGTGETAIDRIRLAMLQGVLALLPMAGTVLNPTDWTKIEMLKDGMGRYIIGDPQGTVAPRLWGLPVVASLALTANTFLTGAFKQASQIFDRMNVEVLISTENNDDFEKNMVTIRCEERLAFVVKRPAAFITGTLP
jgi:HK97 family phage major capsid protein